MARLPCFARQCARTQLMCALPVGCTKDICGFSATVSDLPVSVYCEKSFGDLPGSLDDIFRKLNVMLARKMRGCDSPIVNQSGAGRASRIGRDNVVAARTVLNVKSAATRLHHVAAPYHVYADAVPAQPLAGRHTIRV